MTPEDTEIPLNRVSDFLEAEFAQEVAYVVIVVDPEDGIVHYMSNLKDELVPQLLRSAADHHAASTGQTGAGEAKEGEGAVHHRDNDQIG